MSDAWKVQSCGRSEFERKYCIVVSAGVSPERLGLGCAGPDINVSARHLIY